MNDDPIIIIPSREGSTRLHQKPLIDLNGKSLVQRVFKLALQVTNKTYIATTNMKGKFNYIGGKWMNGYLKTKTKQFGNFCIVADTTKPEIKGVNIFPGKTFNTQTTIKLTIKDKDSGIKFYRGEIDGKWILMDYDHKSNLLRFDIEKNISKGKHTFTLKVVDKVGNTTNYSANFTY